MVSPKHVCVIGAGVSGLAAAKAFAAHGHKVSIIEKSSISVASGIRRAPIPTCRPRARRTSIATPTRPMPASYPEWPKARRSTPILPTTRKATASIAAAVEHRRDRDGAAAPTASPGGRSTSSSRDGSTRREDFDFVAICTGQFNDPQTLGLPGEDAFKAQGGQILHSSTYNDAALAKGRRSSCSAVRNRPPISPSTPSSLARAQSPSSIASRCWRIPYFIGGLVNFKRILYIRAQEQMFPAGASAADARLAHAIAKPFRAGPTGAAWRAC